MMFQTPRRRALTTLALTTLATLPAVGQTVNEVFKLVASDAAEADQFGRSVAISGTTAIVGAYFEGEAFSGNGAAYLFDTATGFQLAKLTPSDTASGDEFGIAVGISGTMVIVGAWKDEHMGINSGSAYLFDTETGQELFKLTASDAAEDDHFGFSVAISGSMAIVGAYGDDDAGSYSGSAYLFDTETGQQFYKLTASDAESFDQFGHSVGIFGTTAIVGAHRDVDAGVKSGSAYLFDTVTGQQLFKFTASDAAADDYFGASVAISGTTAIVGAYGDGDAGPHSGSAYMFDTETGLQLAKLTASDARGRENFGSSVAISGTTAIVGAIYDDHGGTNTGSANLFDTVTGLEIAKITASDAEDGDWFGYSVAISGTTAIVGAMQNDDTGTSSGSAYLFDTEADPVPCPADLNTDGQLDYIDISAFFAAFVAQEPAADLNIDAAHDFIDISLFVSSYTKGCP